MRSFLLLLPSLLLCLLGLGCTRDANRVVVYCALDREFSEQILRDFEERSGLSVVARYDTEANKSVGLYEDLVREAGRPRCDVHWNNEILATIRLHEQGLLAPYDSPAAQPFPDAFRARDRSWTAFAARARILLVNKDRVTDQAKYPRGLRDLLKDEWKGRAAMAKPQFGTTASHAACLFAALGDDKAREFFLALKANGISLLPGNKKVAEAVGRGQFAVGLTDTDDALLEIEAGRNVAIVFPDDDLGTLFLPNTVAMVKGCPNSEGARKLIDYLLSPEVEAKLAQAKSRQIPLNPKVDVDLGPHVKRPSQVKATAVDFAAAAAVWDTSQRFLLKEFFQR